MVVAKMEEQNYEKAMARGEQPLSMANIETHVDYGKRDDFKDWMVMSKWNRHTT